MSAFQYVALLVACAWVMGAVFDVYNTVLTTSKWLRWLCPLLDFCFWLTAAVAVYYVIYRTDNGNLRVYTYVLLGLGYGLYWLLAHRVVIGVAYGVVAVIRVGIHFVQSLLTILLVRPITMVLRLTWGLARSLYWLMRWVEDGFCAVISLFWRLAVYPIRWVLPMDNRFLRWIALWWEDLWDRLAKRLANPPKRV
jgi:spore cortex biosynthesis protein YabQ